MDLVSEGFLEPVPHTYKGMIVCHRSIIEDTVPDNVMHRSRQQGCYGLNACAPPQIHMFEL